ncbi:MAG TPA: hypothetical protein PLM07_10500 [Candidatus Rifleibacterium sp.]|nr:hypothetical protein [Candidatus Rifleibacterium sp.]HPT46320.1 hypothetical protein [Candidatus Rifleibacterium sp.]
MKKILIVFALALAFAGNGCNGNDRPAIPASTDPRAGLISMSPATSGHAASTTAAAATAEHLSPLELSQKQYLDAYNDYVRLLRESGPQTIDTLQALAIYQKQYQIYQMLLKAQNEKAP